MKHLFFFYLIFSYSTSLLSLVVLMLAYLKSGYKSLVYWSVFVAAGALPQFFLTYLDYRYANIPYWCSGYHDVINYLLQAIGIFTVPMIVHEIFAVKHRKLMNTFFGGLLLAAAILIAAPYFQGMLNNGKQIETLPTFKFYSIMTGLAYSYALVIFLFRIKRVENAKERNFYLISAFFALVIYSQGIVPFFKTFPEDMLIYAASAFFWNIFLIRYVVPRFFAEPQPNRDLASKRVIDDFNLTEREKELLLLLAQGMPNKEIGAKLYISEGTVKTHIQNIYKKLGVRNRVQLFHLLRGEDDL